MKQTKTALKELTAAYRAVLKHAAMAAMCVTLSVGGASAIDLDTNVTFAGNYTNEDKTITGNVNTAPTGESYTYQSTDKNGNLVSNDATYNGSADNGVDADKFKYQNPDGSEGSLKDNANPDMADYKAASVADSTKVKMKDGTTDVVYNGDEKLSKELYEYKDSTPDGWLSLAQEPVSETTVTLSNGQEVKITNGESTEFSGEMYEFTDGGVHYRLNANGDKVVNDLNQIITPEEGSVLEGLANEAMAAFASDKSDVDAAKTSTGAEYSANKALYDAALIEFGKDSDLFDEQKSRYATVEAATAQWQEVNNAESPAWATAMADLDEKSELYSKASDLYNSSIVDVVNEANATNTAAIAANTESINTEVERATAAESALDGKITANETAIAANSAAITAEVSARATGDAETLASAKSYADTQDALILSQAKAYVDSQGALTLKSANDYTDQKVSSLEKEMSAGIASATALSSVAVSGVKKGEVSVGGGYGYYNSQSAVALGATMGLTDNWSVNAGAGLSDSNVAFRAGTNYKFKLF